MPIKTGKNKLLSIKPLVYFIGIGGIGVSSLARWFLSQNWTVAGSDIAASAITKELSKNGIRVKIGHKKDNLPARTILVICSQAIPPGNPEVQEARRRNLPILSYPEAVGGLTRSYTTIAIAGAHGKSTTTALTALVLLRAGLDPTVIIGVKLKELRGSNFRAGAGQYLVLEADEFGRAFLKYSPVIAVLTNIDKEHLEVYKSLSGVKKAFLSFLGRVKPGGTYVLNRDDKNLYSLRAAITRLARARKIKTFWFSTRQPVVKKIKNILHLSGAHNLSNALAAFTVAGALRLPEKKILAALHAYTGAWRRLEYRGKWKMENGKWKIPVYDDYAHHPTEIRATLAALKEKHPRTKIICVFQPHQTQRLTALYPEFVSAFRDANLLVLLPVYKVVGRDQASARYSSQHLAQDIYQKQTCPAVVYLQDPKKLKRELAALISPPFPGSAFVLVMMGAGNIFELTGTLLKK